MKDNYYKNDMKISSKLILLSLHILAITLIIYGYVFILPSSFIRNKIALPNGKESINTSFKDIAKNTTDSLIQANKALRDSAFVRNKNLKISLSNYKLCSTNNHYLISKIRENERLLNTSKLKYDILSTEIRYAEDSIQHYAVKNIFLEDSINTLKNYYNKMNDSLKKKIIYLNKYINFLIIKKESNLLDEKIKK